MIEPVYMFLEVLLSPNLSFEVPGVRIVINDYYNCMTKRNWITYITIY